MSKLPEPPRWLESDALSPELRRELIAYANSGPSSDRRARMLSQLENQVAVGAAHTGARAMLSSYVKLATFAATVAGTIALWSLFAKPAAPLLLRAESESAVEWRAHEPAFESAAPEKQPLVSAASDGLTQGTASPLRGLAPRPTPLRERLASQVEGSGATLSVRGPVESQSPVLPELLLLARARRALLVNPTRALELVEEHARRYPRGTFEEEREVLAIESLLKLSSVAEARRRARTFQRRFPQSTHRTHLEGLVSQD